MVRQTSSVPLLRATAHELQQRLATGLTSVELVEACLAQIERHNHNGMKLNAIVSVCPREIAIEQARRCDKERAEGKVRSAIHGIPIVLKVEFPLRSIVLGLSRYSKLTFIFSSGCYCNRSSSWNAYNCGLIRLRLDEGHTERYPG